MAIQDKYCLSFEEHSAYLIAGVEADALTPDLTSEYQQKIAAEIHARRAKLVIIKRDVPVSSTVPELYRIPFLVDPWNAHGIRYAFVDANSANLNIYKLALLDAKARGFDIAVFDDIASAKEWIRVIAPD